MLRCGNLELTSMSYDLVVDWRTIWDSELAGMARDRELLEGAPPALALWLAMSGGPHDPAGVARPHASSRPSAPDAAPDPWDAEIALLSARIDALEQKLGRFEERNLGEPDKRKLPKPRSRKLAEPKS